MLLADARNRDDFKKLMGALWGNPAFLGMSCTLTWAFLVNAACVTSTDQSPWSISYVVFSLIVPAIALIVRKRLALLSGSIPSAVASVVGAAASVTLVLSRDIPQMNDFMLPSMIACVAVLGWLYMQWGRFYALLDTRLMILCAFSSGLVGSLLKTFVHFVPSTIGFIVTVSLPMVSAFTASWAICNAPQSEKPAIRFEAKSVLRNLAKVLVAIVLFSFTTAFAINANVVNQSAIPSLYFILARLLEMAISLAVLFYVGFQGKSFNFSELWRIVLLILAVDLVCVVTFPANASVHCLESSVWDLLVLCTWVTAADISRHTRGNSPLVLGFIWPLYSLPFAIGTLLSPVLAPHGISAGQVSLLMLTLLVVSSICLESRDQDTKWLFSDLWGEASVRQGGVDSLDDRCEQLAKEHDLTPREQEIMQYLCKGRTKAYIAEALYLTENTVKTHSKRIYTKLGIHSKRELLDLVER